MGQYFVGQILGVGPQGGVGTDNHAYILRPVPQRLDKGNAPPYDIPHILHTGIP